MVRKSQHHTRVPAGPELARWARRLLPLVFVVVSASAQVRRTPPTDTPAIAQIAGVRVGVDTLKALKARLGAGAPMKSCRGLVWTWKAADCLIRATFDPPPAGLPADTPPFDSDVIRAVALEGAKRAPDTRPGSSVHGYVRDLGWMGAVIPGITQARLNEITRRLPGCEQHGKEMIWRAALDPAPVPPPPSTRWAAVVRMERGKVISVRVAAQ
jgi:hypothetical protein